MAKYEYKRILWNSSGVRLSEDIINKHTEGDWRLHTVFETAGILLFEREVPIQIEIKDTPELRAAIEAAYPHNVRFGKPEPAFEPCPETIDAQVKGEDLPPPPAPSVLASYLGTSLENVLVAAMEAYKDPDAHWVTSHSEQAITDIAAFDSLLDALKNDTYLMMTCTAPDPCGPDISPSMPVEVEAANPDVVAPTTVPSAVSWPAVHAGLFPDAPVAPPAPMPNWTAGWSFVGNDGAEFRVGGSFTHCAEELMDSLQKRADGDVPPTLRRDLMEAQRQWRREAAAEKWSLQTGDILVWIRPV